MLHHVNFFLIFFKRAPETCSQKQYKLLIINKKGASAPLKNKLEIKLSFFPSTKIY